MKKAKCIWRRCSAQYDRLSLIKPTENIPLRNTSIVKKSRDRWWDECGGECGHCGNNWFYPPHTVGRFYIKYQVSPRCAKWTASWIPRNNWFCQRIRIFFFSQAELVRRYVEYMFRGLPLVSVLIFFFFYSYVWNCVCLASYYLFYLFINNPTINYYIVRIFDASYILIYCAFFETYLTKYRILRGNFADYTSQYGK